MCSQKNYGGDFIPAEFCASARICSPFPSYEPMNQYNQEMKSKLRVAYQLVGEYSKKAAYGCKVRGQFYGVNDSVLLHSTAAPRCLSMK